MINAIFIDGPKHSTEQQINHAFDELHFARLPEVIVPRGMFDIEHQHKISAIFAKLGIELATPTIETIVEHYAYRRVGNNSTTAIYRYIEPIEAPGDDE